MTKPGFTSLRNIVHSVVFTEFKQRKDELFLDRIVAFKNNDWQTYSQLVITAQTEHKTLLREREEQAANFIGLSIESYEKSKVDTMADQVYMAQMQKHDLELAKSDVVKNVTEPLAEIKQALTEMMQTDHEAFCKL